MVSWRYDPDAPVEEIDIVDPDPDRREVPEPYGEEWQPCEVEIDTTTPLEDF